MTARRSAVLGAGSVAVGFADKAVLRPLVDGGPLLLQWLSGSGPSFFYTCGFALLWQIAAPARARLFVVAVVAGSLLYEVHQARDSDPFDVPDAVATVLGGAAAWLILRSRRHQTHESSEDHGSL